MSITNDAAALDAKLESGELSLESLKIDEKQAAAELEAEEAATNSGKLKEEEEKTEAVLHDEAKMRPLITEFREKIAATLATAIPAGEEWAIEVNQSDKMVVKFLTARKFNVKDAVTMFESALKWRRENKIDRILDDPYPDGPMIKKMLNCHCDHYYDKLGRPVYIEFIGKMEPEKILKQIDMPRMMRYQYHTTEFRRKFITRMSAVSSGQVNDQLFSILDLKGFGSKHINKTTYKFIKELAAVTQANYPEVLGKLVVINAPTLFSVAWKAIKVWLDDRVKSKIEIHKDNGLNSLKQYIDEKYLPLILGGKCTCGTNSTDPNKTMCLDNAPAQVSYMHLCTLGLKDWATIGINQQLLDMLSKTPEEQLQDIKKLHEQQEAAKQPSKAS